MLSSRTAVQIVVVILLPTTPTRLFDYPSAAYLLSGNRIDLHTTTQEPAQQLMPGNPSCRQLFFSLFLSFSLTFTKTRSSSVSFCCLSVTKEENGWSVFKRSVLSVSLCFSLGFSPLKHIKRMDEFGSVSLLLLSRDLPLWK